MTKEKLREMKKKGVILVKERKQPHEQLTMKNNGLTSMQEVLYRKEFKQADKKMVKNDQNKK